MPTLSAKVCRELLDFVRMAEAAPDQPVMPRPAAWIAALENALRPKRSLAPARKRREAKRQSRREKIAPIRARVFDRAQGVCEAAEFAEALGLGRCDGALDWAHRYGGSGRRRKLESVATTAAICRSHHMNEHASWPSRAAWLSFWERLAEKHGYGARA